MSGLGCFAGKPESSFFLMDSRLRGNDDEKVNNRINAWQTPHYTPLLYHSGEGRNPVPFAAGFPPARE